MKRNTEKNREMLAAEIVDQMDLGTMIDVLIEQHETFYEGFSNEDFEREWRKVFGED
ncbi:hypothetical protein LCGC14_1308810 [marine sediment metagenome]|uniref:Uncharacterized protein n=1 Tax=marine sediment metagenome TaxID=412755 RepID=A0A0F9N452_9ZZZZ